MPSARLFLLLLLAEVVVTGLASTADYAKLLLEAGFVTGGRQFGERVGFGDKLGRELFEFGVVTPDGRQRLGITDRLSTGDKAVERQLGHRGD